MKASGTAPGCSILVLAGGLAMLPAFVLINLLGPRLGTPTYVLLAALACAGYLTAILPMFIARQAPSGWLLATCFVLAAAFRAPLLVTEPGIDVFRYLWDAHVQRAGYNPYQVIPADPALRSLQTPETRRINNSDVPTPYPPGAQLFFRLVFRLNDRAYAFKVALALADLGLAIILCRWLTGIGAAPGWSIVYAWNPLVILVTSGAGHLDLLGAFWLMASVLLLTNGRRLPSALCFAMAVAIKPLPVVLAPMFWRRIRPLDAAAAAALLALLYAPYAAGGRFPMGSLGVFVERFRFNQTVFDSVSAVLGVRGAALFAVAAGMAVSALLRVRLPVTKPAAWAWPMATALVLSPVIYPWYLVWLIPFATSLMTLPLLVWSIAIIFTYAVWHLYDLGRPWVVPHALLSAEYGIALATAVGVAAASLVARDRRPDHVTS